MLTPVPMMAKIAHGQGLPISHADTMRPIHITPSVCSLYARVICPE